MLCRSVIRVRNGGSDESGVGVGGAARGVAGARVEEEGEGDGDDGGAEDEVVSICFRAIADEDEVNLAAKKLSHFYSHRFLRRSDDSGPSMLRSSALFLVN